jgi:hypothetical protein
MLVITPTTPQRSSNCYRVPYHIAIRIIPQYMKYLQSTKRKERITNKS